VQRRRRQLADDLLVTLHLHRHGGGGVINMAALCLRHGATIIMQYDDGNGGVI
jgi:hypothetical protein